MEQRALSYFPYSAYSVQRELVHELTRLLRRPRVRTGNLAEDAHIGIFESPTGTGKTMSLLCGALAWLRDELDAHSDSRTQENQPSCNSQGILFPSEPDWVQEARLALPRRPPPSILDNARPKRRKAGVNDPIAELLAMVGTDDGDDGPGRSAAAPPPRRVYYCSRTHSQLSQVMGELQRILQGQDKRLASAAAQPAVPSASAAVPTKAISLASRKSLCINDSVRRLGSAERINEKCQELLTADGCPYYNRDKEADMRVFLEHLPPVADIEEIVRKGKTHCVCPYYGSREQSRTAELIALPYHMILHRGSRDALDLDLKDALVIFDEAHNLVDFVNEMNSCSICVADLPIIVTGLRRYLDRFRGRLAPENALRLQQLLHLTVRIHEHLASCPEQGTKEEEEDGGRDGERDSGRDREWDGNDRHCSGYQAGKQPQVWPINPFLIACSIDHINLLPILEYARSSHLSHKLASFYGSDGSGDAAPGTQSSALLLSNWEALLNCLTHANSDGRLILQCSALPSSPTSAPTSMTLKYVALNPSLAMQEITQEAHSVILAGGTMSPLDDVILQLFPHHQQAQARCQVLTRSFAHLVPAENVSAMIAASGPVGRPFRFTHANRQDEAMFLDLGQFISNVCHVTPDGVAVFFPSFSMLDHFVTVWGEQRAASSKPLGKRLHIESPSIVDLEVFLRRYAHDCHTGEGGGALLLAVMGGRLSEGVNLADRLARALLVVGLPFPNVADPELRLRSQYYAQLQRQQGDNDAAAQQQEQAYPARKPSLPPSNACTEYYENICLRTVNQTIGRAIRHQHDWASIILLDERYQQLRIRTKLSAWYQASLARAGGEGRALAFSPLFSNLARFFRAHRS